MLQLRGNGHVHRRGTTEARLETSRRVVRVRPRLTTIALCIVVGIPVARALDDSTAAPSLAEYLTTLCAASFRSASAEEIPFLAENSAAMGKMIAAMVIRPAGNVDDDFVAMMVPHHQAAMDMAQAELRYGRNEQLRRIAQEIVVEQQQQIAAMRFAAAQPLPPATAAPDQAPAPAIPKEQ